MTDHTIGSGNVFADIGFDRDEAQALAAKSRLVRHIAGILTERGLTQSEAADLFGTSQSHLSRVLSGRTSSVSIEKLASWLDRLGWEVRITAVSRSASPGTGDAVPT